MALLRDRYQFTTAQTMPKAWCPHNQQYLHQILQNRDWLNISTKLLVTAHCLNHTWNGDVIQSSHICFGCYVLMKIRNAKCAIPLYRANQDTRGQRFVKAPQATYQCILHYSCPCCPSAVPLRFCRLNTTRCTRAYSIGREPMLTRTPSPKRLLVFLRNTGAGCLNDTT